MAPTNCQSMKKSRGFTLIELMVVIAIVAILTTLAAPSFTQLIQSNTISGSVNTFLADMRYARSESIKRGGSVVMCRSDDPEIADPNCGTDSGTGGRGWVTGWFIFHDLDGDGTKDANEEVLRRQSPISAIDYALENGGSSSTKFVFTATGRMKNINSATQLQFGGAKFSSQNRRVLCISLGGRARIAGDGDKSCSTDK